MSVEGEEALGLRWEDVKQALCLLTRELQHHGERLLLGRAPAFHVSLRNPMNGSATGPGIGIRKKRMQTNTSGGETE